MAIDSSVSSLRLPVAIVFLLTSKACNNPSEYARKGSKRRRWTGKIGSEKLERKSVERKFPAFSSLAAVVNFGLFSFFWLHELRSPVTSPSYYNLFSLSSASSSRHTFTYRSVSGTPFYLRYFSKTFHSDLAIVSRSIARCLLLRIKLRPPPQLQELIFQTVSRRFKKIVSVVHPPDPQKTVKNSVKLGTLAKRYENIAPRKKNARSLKITKSRGRNDRTKFHVKWSHGTKIGEIFEKKSWKSSPKWSCFLGAILILLKISCIQYTAAFLCLWNHIRSLSVVIGHCFEMASIASYFFSLVLWTVESCHVLSTIVWTLRWRENDARVGTRKLWVAFVDEGD